MRLWFEEAAGGADNAETEPDDEGEDEDEAIFDNRNTDNFVEVFPATLAIDGDGAEDVGGDEGPALPAGEAEAIHLGDDEHGGEAEHEHGPDGEAGGIGDDSAVEEDGDFLHEHPPAIKVDTGEEEATLEEEEESIEEAHQVADGGFHGMVPEGVDDTPSEDIAMIFTHDAATFFEEADFFAEEKATALVFHQ